MCAQLSTPKVMLHFGTDGVRGTAFEDLSVESVRDLGRAIARVLSPSAVVVGRDTRQSGPSLQSALVQGITAEGIEVHLLGVAPTPAVAFIAETHDWVGVSITASHNPWKDNGIKVFAAGGAKLSDAQQVDIEREWHAVSTAEQGIPEAMVHSATELLDEYIDHRVSIVGEGRLSGLTVALDCANGAMSEVAAKVLSRTGATVDVINAGPDGTNINDGCGATHPATLATHMTNAHAELGLSFDGDGDRVIGVTADGNIVDGDRLIALAAIDLAQRGLLRNKSVAVTVMSNLGFHRAMQSHDIEVVVTPVGDRHVLEALEQSDLVLGGEQSGHIIYAAHATTGDGLLAGIMLAEYLQRTKSDFSRVSQDVMTSYPQVLVNVRTNNKIADPAEVLAAQVATAEHLLAGNGRVLLRASGTEPVIRVMVEAETAELAREVAGTLADAVRAADEAH
jgi:phosphoglucosamine mutase